MVMPQLIPQMMGAAPEGPGVLPLLPQELLNLQGPVGGTFALPDPNVLLEALSQVPPEEPTRPCPSDDVLKARKKRIQDFWRRRNSRMAEDDQIYKRRNPLEKRRGDVRLGEGLTHIGNDPWVLVEKVSNMMARQEAVLSIPLKDPGLKDLAQKVKDFCYWFRDKTNRYYGNRGNNNLTRAEVHSLNLRGWLTGRVMLDPQDPDFPYRYDIFDPLTVYPEFGGKSGLRWVFHIYRETKAAILSDFGWSQEVLDLIEERTKGLDDYAKVEVAAYFDDTWHVLFLDDKAIWRAPHGYGVVPWVIRTATGPPTWMTDVDAYADTPGAKTFAPQKVVRADTYWWGTSIFEGIKETYSTLNKVTSAILTAAMSAPNPAVAIYGDESTEEEGKTLDTGIGGTTHFNRAKGEDYKIVESGFKASETNMTLQFLMDQRNRGTLPAVMYGEGAQYLSGFAVNLLQAGSQDLLFPIIAAHESYLEGVFYIILKLLGEIYPAPVNMVGTDPNTGYRSRISQLTGAEVKMVGYDVTVKYKNVFPRDLAMMTDVAVKLLNAQLADLDTLRGEEYLGFKNAQLINRKVLADQAWKDPLVVKAAIPSALLMADPPVYLLWKQAREEEQRLQMMQMMLGGMGAPPGQGPQGQSPQTPPLEPQVPTPQGASRVQGAPF